MKYGRGPIVAIALVGTALGVARSLPAKAAPQAGQPGSDPMAVLLTEVHALRLAMEQTATTTPRLQLTLARLTIAEQRVSHLTVQLEDVRKQLADNSIELQKIGDLITENERAIQFAPDDQTRRQGEFEHRDMKRRQAWMAAIDRQLRERENEDAQALSTEQSRWFELNSRLDELERLLSPVPR